MYRNNEIHRTASTLANIAVSALARNGVREAAVVVTIGPWTHHPLAIRVPGNDGFGSGHNYGSISQRQLLVEAGLQAEYQLEVGGREASQQEKKLAETGRKASSYSYLLKDGVKARFAHDHETNLTLVITSPEVDDQESANLAENAITLMNSGTTAEKLPATELVEACLFEIRRKLPKDRTGFAMIAAPNQTINHTNPMGEIPAIFCSQSAGLVVEPANFGIVAAKARTVAISRKASGPASSELWSDISQIPGAIAVSVKGNFERVLAGGGLVDGVDDVTALRDGMRAILPKFEVKQIVELNRIQVR